MEFDFNIITIISFLLCVVLLIIIISLKRKLNNLTEQLSGDICYKKLFQSLPIPIFYIDSSKDTTYTNKSFDVSFGTNRAKTIQLLSKPFKNTSHQISLTYDNKIEKEVLVISSNMLDKSYEKSAIVGVLLDIDNFKKEIAYLLNWKQKYALAVEGSQFGLWEWKISGNNFNASHKWKEIMGYRKNEEPHNLNSWLNMVDTRDMAKVNEALNAHLKGLNNLFEIEHRIRLSKDTKWISVRGKALFNNEKKAIKISGLIHDISKRKELELSSNENQKLFINYMDNLPGLAFIKDEQNRYLYINRYFENFIGFTEWKNKTPVDLFDGETAKSILENDKKTFFQDQKRSKETITNGEGVQKSFEIHKFIIKNENGEKFLCGFGGELTEH